ncbi:hypothetical protein BDR04DRAFT_1163562 [Suillus decipiens]|nr:hypothetical protein BDR04DRAFT_1163562 [Suillus decipiens]
MYTQADIPPPPMNPFCLFRDWSLYDGRQLLKAKGTIQDVDGECTLKVTGPSRKGCPVAPHYRLPLYALNKKFGIYRKVVEHLEGSHSIGASHMRNTYLSVMQYLHDVRTAFVDDAEGSQNPLHGDFRSAALDYYLWLDHTSHGFHDECCEALYRAHGVTYESLKNGQSPDVLKFLDWKTYHDEKCKEHDFCGALQGCGQGEDIESLLHDVDACIEAEDAPICTDAPDPDSCAEALPVSDHTYVTSLATLGDCPRKTLIHSFGVWLISHIAMRFREIQGLHDNDPLDEIFSNGSLLTARNSDEFLEIFGMTEMMNVCDELGVDRSAMTRFFTAVGRTLYESQSGKLCIVEYGQRLLSSHTMENSRKFRIPRDVNLIDTKETSKAFAIPTDIDTKENPKALMIPMDIDMHLLDTEETTKASKIPTDVDTKESSDAFMIPTDVHMHLLHTKENSEAFEISTGINRHLVHTKETSDVHAIQDIYMPLLDIKEKSEAFAKSTDIDTHLNSCTFVTVGVQCIDLHLKFPTVVAVGVQCEPIIDHTIPVPSNRAMLDVGLQTDIDIEDSFDMCDAIHGLSVPVVCVSDIYKPGDKIFGDTEYDVSSQMLHEELCEQYTDYNSYVLSSSSQTDCSSDVSPSQSCCLETSNAPPQDEAKKLGVSHDDNPRCDIYPLDEPNQPLQAVQQRTDMPISPPLKSRLRERKISSKGITTAAHGKRSRSKAVRPVIFATQGPVPEEISNVVQEDFQHETYTIEGLVCESDIGATDVTPLIASFLMDHNAINFVRSTIESDHHSWLKIARHVALLLRNECIPPTMIQTALLLMSFDMWLSDVGMECQESLHNKNGNTGLPPLAHCVILELSTRVLSDEASHFTNLTTFILPQTIDNNKSIMAALRYLLRVSQPHNDNPYAPALRILASMMKDRTQNQNE